MVIIERITVIAVAIPIGLVNKYANEIDNAYMEIKEFYGSFNPEVFMDRLWQVFDKDEYDSVKFYSYEVEDLIELLINQNNEDAVNENSPAYFYFYD